MVHVHYSVSMQTLQYGITTQYMHVHVILCMQKTCLISYNTAGVAKVPQSKEISLLQGWLHTMLHIQHACTTSTRNLGTTSMP